MAYSSFLISTERLSRYRIIWGRRKRWREVALELVLGTLNRALAYGTSSFSHAGRDLCRAGRGSKPGDRGNDDAGHFPLFVWLI